MSEIVNEEAIAWFACMHSDVRSRTDEDRFAQWLKQDARHEEAYAQVEKVWRAAGPAIVPRSAPAAHAEPLRRRAEPRWLAIAAGIVALSIAAAWFYVERSPISRGSFVTATGGQRELKLVDGSVVTLNTRSEVSVDFSDRQRLLRLVRGEARFNVAREVARPFTVDTGTVRVRALGTRFDVRVSDTNVAVTLVEGRVEVASIVSSPASPHPVMMRPGQQLAIETGSGREKLQPVSLERADAWLHRQLIFDALPLRDAIAEANRYLPNPIVIQDAALNDIRISGVVRAGSPESLIGSLESSFPIKAITRAGATVLVASQ